MIIAVTGPAGSGKDTLVENIVKNLPNFTQKSFAAPLKTFCSRVLGREIDKGIERDFLIYVGEFFKGHDAPYPQILEKNPTLVAKLMGNVVMLADEQINYGNVPFTDYFWADQLLQEISDFSHTAISDIRFPAEFEVLRDQKRQPVVFVELQCSREECERRLLDRDSKVPVGLWESRAENAWKDEPKDIYINVENLTPDEVYREFLAQLSTKGI